MEAVVDIIDFNYKPASLRKLSLRNNSNLADSFLYNNLNKYAETLKISSNSRELYNQRRCVSQNSVEIAVFFFISREGKKWQHRILWDFHDLLNKTLLHNQRFNARNIWARQMRKEKIDLQKPLKRASTGCAKINCLSLLSESKMLQIIEIFFSFVNVSSPENELKTWKLFGKSQARIPILIGHQESLKLYCNQNLLTNP